MDRVLSDEVGGDILLPLASSSSSMSRLCRFSGEGMYSTGPPADHPRFSMIVRTDFSRFRVQK